MIQESQCREQLLVRGEFQRLNGWALGARIRLEIRIHFYSYFKELAGAAQVVQVMAAGSRIGDLLDVMGERFPKLAGLRQLECSWPWESIIRSPITC